jgi:hypothetical protein
MIEELRIVKEAALNQAQTLTAQLLLLSFKQYDAEVARHGYGPIREMTTEEIIDAARRG